MRTIQTRANGERVCTICASPHAEALRVALAEGESATSLARRYNVSVDALGRHRRAGHEAARLIVIDPDTAALGLIDSTVTLLQLARAAAAHEYSRGNNRLGAQVSDTALRAVGTLRDLGLDADALTADIAAAKDARRKAYRLSKAVEDLLETHPDLIPEMADHAEARGLLDIAAILRADDTEEQS
jgi:hypothetical protein